MFEGVYKEADLFAGNKLSCFCPDFLASQVECDVDNKTFIRRTESQLWAQDRETVGGTGEISELSNVCGFICEASSDQSTWVIEKMGTNELWDGIGRSLEWDISAKDKVLHKSPSYFGAESLNPSGFSFNPFHHCLTANENEADMIWFPNNSIDGLSALFESISDIDIFAGSENFQVSAEDAQKSNISRVGESEYGLWNFEVEESADIICKRLRKPPQRYIEETAEVNSRCERSEISSITSDRFCVIAGDKSHLKETKTREWFSSKWDAGPIIQRPRNLRGHRGQRRKATSCLVNDSINKEDFLSSTKAKVPRASKLQDYLAKDWIERNEKEKYDIRRKHHRVWTLPEVMKLIEGVSQYGVGKWTEIKRLSFSTSSFRTSVDLKDKWRNLLRASAVQMHNRKQSAQHKKHTTAQIPQSVLRRIRELSVIHPYPSDPKAKTTGSKDANLQS